MSKLVTGLLVPSFMWRFTKSFFVRGIIWLRQLFWILYALPVKLSDSFNLAVSVLEWEQQVLGSWKNVCSRLYTHMFGSSDTEVFFPRWSWKVQLSAKILLKRISLRPYVTFICKSRTKFQKGFNVRIRRQCLKFSNEAI